MKKTKFYAIRKAIAICMATFSVIIVIAFSSFTIISRATDETWKLLGITQREGADKIKNSFLNDYLDYGGVNNIKNLATGNKVAIAKDMLAYAKQYVNSKAFQDEYIKMRNESNPGEATTVVRTKDEIRSEKVEETKDLIKKTEATIKDATPDMKKVLQPILDMHKKNLADYQDPNSKMIEMFYQQEVFKQQDDKRYFAESRKKWEANYPADYKQVIKARLKRYLDIAATVDFAAQLNEKNGRQKFVNNAYEGKNNEWKMVFRAGKDINDVAVSFCQQWLKELQ